jgi:hypothetical protein
MKTFTSRTKLMGKLKKTMIKVKLRLLALVPSLLLTFSAWSQASADFINSPSTNNVNIGDVFSVTIQVAPTNTGVSVAEAHLKFNPAFLQVVSLTPAAEPLDMVVVGPSFDNSIGTIDFAAFNLFAPFPTTTFNFLTIEFQAVGVTAGTQVTHEQVNLPVSLIAFEGQSLLNVANPINVAITDPDAPAGCQEVLFRVNNGGVQTAAGDASIPAWGEDTQANPSPYLTLGTCSNCNKTYSTFNSIDMTHPSLIGTGITEAIMKTERWDHSDLPEMEWNFPVTPGSQVEIKLFFAELFVNNPGERVFDVAVEGVVPPVFDNIDPLALAGAKFKGVMVSHTQIINDNNLDLDFLHVIQNPAVKAIQVCLISGEEPPCDLAVTVVTTDPVSCAGNGSVDIQVSGGSGNEVITIYDQNENLVSDPGNLPPGNYTYEVNDGSCQATGEFSINQYNDDAAPTIACPSNQSGSFDSNCEFALPDYTALATAEDNCDASPALTQFPAAGAIVTGNTTVTLTATDAAGNSSSCSFEVTVSDQTPPSITCPGDQNEALDENGEFILPDYTGLADASDNCDAIVNVTQNPTAGTIVTTNTTVTLTATDAAGNSSNCTFEVIPSDQLMLSITCPGDQTGIIKFELRIHATGLYGPGDRQL